MTKNPENSANKDEANHIDSNTRKLARFIRINSGKETFTNLAVFKIEDKVGSVGNVHAYDVKCQVSHFDGKSRISMNKKINQKVVLT